MLPEKKTHMGPSQTNNLHAHLQTAESRPTDPPLESNLISLPSEQVNAASQAKPKKKYSSRMRQLAPHITTLTSTYHYRSGDSPQLQSARARNNIASQSSRARKKMYMKLLEDQIVDLQLQLQQTTDQIEMFRTQIFNALMHTDEVSSQNAQIQSHVLKKLKALVQEQRTSKRNTEINICLDSCLYRIGASGSERKAILDILYKGMINRNLPNIYRYILWCAANETHLFGGGGGKKNAGFESWWNEIKEVGEEVILKNQNFLKEKGEPLGKKAKEILRCSRQILQQKQEIQNYGHGYDSMLKTFREILTPVQFAQLFLFVERSVHKKELQLLDDDKDENSQQRAEKKEKDVQLSFKRKRDGGEEEQKGKCGEKKVKFEED